MTGFVLLSVLSVDAIVLSIGVALLVIGVLVSWWLNASRPTLPGAATAVVAVVSLLASPSACDHETAYYCVRIETEADSPQQRSLWLDQLRHGFVDLDDPTNLDIRYVRLLADIADAFDSGPIEVAHIGGAAFSMPRYIEATRPGSSQVVFEIDSELVEIAQQELGLVLEGDLRVQIGDGRLSLGGLKRDSFDLVIGDAFGSEAVPWHLTTVQVATEIESVLRPGGIYAINLIDGVEGRFTAALLATLRERFDHVAVIQPTDPTEPTESSVRVNYVVLASNTALGPIAIDADDGRLVHGDPWGNGKVLTDSFAPVDQLID